MGGVAHYLDGHFGPIRALAIAGPARGVVANHLQNNAGPSNANRSCAEIHPGADKLSEAHQHGE